jgi:hypothetical protein
MRRLAVTARAVRCSRTEQWVWACESAVESARKSKGDAHKVIAFEKSDWFRKVRRQWVKKSRF